MSAKAIARALGGSRVGTTWMARCPAHADREPSLSIKDGDGGRVLVRCRAGCDQERVIATLRSRGLWENRTRRFIRPAPRAATSQHDRDDSKRSKAALAIWRSAFSADGSLVKAYLDSRGLHLPPPPTLRFHAGLKHPSGGIWPAMVALVTHGSNNTPFAIHRTILTRNGGEAPVNPQKIMLGPCHAVLAPPVMFMTGGGAVRLGLPGDVLMVSERYWKAPRLQQQGGRP
jgi:putative DNA primase/helicase